MGQIYIRKAVAGSTEDHLLKEIDRGSVRHGGEECCNDLREMELLSCGLVGVTALSLAVLT